MAQRTERCRGLGEVCPEARGYGFRVIPTLIQGGQIVFEGRISSAPSELPAQPSRE
jgi:hypothetical protein